MHSHKTMKIYVQPLSYLWRMEDYHRFLLHTTSCRDIPTLLHALWRYSNSSQSVLNKSLFASITLKEHIDFRVPLTDTEINPTKIVLYDPRTILSCPQTTSIFLKFAWRILLRISGVVKSTVCWLLFLVSRQNDPSHLPFTFYILHSTLLWYSKRKKKYRWISKNIIQFFLKRIL